MRSGRPACRSSLASKVMRAYVVGVLLSALLILAIVAGVVIFRDTVLDHKTRWLASDLAEQFAFGEDGRPSGLRPDVRHSEWAYDSLRRELGYRVLDRTGQVVLYSPAGEWLWQTMPFAAPGAGPQRFTQDGIVFHAATEAFQHGGQTWYVQFAASDRVGQLVGGDFTLPFIGRGITLFSLILLLVFGVCVFLTIRRTFRPLRELSAAAAAISPRSMDARLPLEGVPAEVVPLVASFNSVLERLEQGYRVQQDFLATAAHELKTPLALLRAQIELEPSGDSRSAMLADLAHMSRQVQQLLVLAEASEARNYQFEPVDVMRVTDETARYLRRMADAAGVRLELAAERVRPSWLGDRAALFTLLKNLVENAIQHAPRGSRVLIQAGVSAISVRDFGPGADEAQIARMFERFWRGEHRRDQGAGLGLSICMEIARAHGWTLRATRVQPGLCLMLERPEGRAPVATAQADGQAFNARPDPEHSAVRGEPVEP